MTSPQIAKSVSALASNATPTESVIIIDDPDLFREITRLLKSPRDADKIKGDIKQLAPEGTGFTRSQRFEINGTAWNFLLLNPKDAHPFAYLTIGQRSRKFNLSQVIAICQARSLRRDIYPGDVALVSEATALPYPALYENKDPLSQNALTAESAKTTETYSVQPENLARFKDFVTEKTLPQIWQDSVKTVRAGYTKHPAWAGSLEPWAPEQFQTIKDSGIDTLSETPAGIYEATRLNPSTQTICINMITGYVDNADNGEWRRYKRKLLYPAMRLILDIIDR